MKSKFMRGLALFMCLSMVLGFIPGGLFGNAIHVHAEEITPDAGEEVLEHTSSTLAFAESFDSVSTNYAGVWKTLCSGAGTATVVYDAEAGSNVLKINDPYAKEPVASAVELEGAKFPVAGGQNYNLSLKVKQDAAWVDQTTSKASLYVFWLGEDGKFLDADGDGTLTDPEYFSLTKLPNSAEWTDVHVTVAVPEGAVSAYLRFNTFVGDMNCVYVDDVSFVRDGTLLTSSFDGNIETQGWSKVQSALVMNYEHAVSGKSIIFQNNSGAWAQTPAKDAVPGFTYTAKFTHSKTLYNGATEYSVGTGGRANMFFVDANGNVLEENIITIGEQNEWVEETLTARAPANTAKVYVKFYVDSTYTGDPCFSLENFSLTETEGEVLQPVELPMLPSGDFEHGTAGWKNLQLIEGAGRDGSTALLVDSVNRQKDVEMTYTIPVEAGTTYNVTFWAKRAVTDANQRGITMYVFYKDANGNFLDANGDGTLQDKEYYKTVGANPAVADPEAEEPTTEWQQYAMSFTAPAGTASIFYRFYASSSFADSAIYVDDLVMEKAPLVTNGDFSNGSSGWKGSAIVANNQVEIPITAPAESNGKRPGLYIASTNGIPAVGGDTYVLTFKAARTANEARTGAEEDNVYKVKDSGNAYVGFWTYDASGAFVDAKTVTINQDELLDYELSFTFPENVATFKIELGVNSNSGAAFIIDDIAVINEKDVLPTIEAPEYGSFADDFNAYTSVYTGWTGDYTVTTAGMKLNGTATATPSLIAGAAYSVEAVGAEATIENGVITLTGEDALVSAVNIYLLCADDDADHNCDVCGVKLSDCTYGNCDLQCSICGEWRLSAPHGTITYVEAKDAVDCATPGNVEYWHCEDCGADFFDEALTQMSGPFNPVTVTVDCVRPEGVADCADVTCELCGNTIYGYGDHDVLVCQGGTCSKCGAEVEGVGCANYDTPACEDGTCYYCGGFVAGAGHENGAWADCMDGECAYGCGLVYPATADHADEDADGYCDNCWSHLVHTAPEDADPCVGYECADCFTWVAGAHDWSNGTCGTCGTVCEHDTDAGVCGICGMESYYAGHENNPIGVFTQSANLTVAAGKTYNYYGYFSGMIMTVTGSDYAVIVGGATLTPDENGVVSTVVTSANPRMPANFAIVNNGDADAEFSVAFTYRVGTMDNPAQAVLGDNTASVEAGSQGYYWTYTAEKDGTLLVTISGADGWTYAVNNMTTYVYGDTQWSDSDPVVNPYEVEVAEGDTIVIMVNSYDPADMWNTPAATLTVNLAYAVEGPAIDEDLSFGTVGMLLGADIRGVFVINYKPATSPYTSFKVFVNKNGVESEVELASESGTTTKYLAYAITMNAKEMADVITVTIAATTAEGEVFYSNPVTWSIKQGAIALLDARAGKTDDTSVIESALIANMLAYGAAAQKNFEYNLDNLATDGLADEYAALIKTTTPEMTEIPKTEQTGATVKLSTIGFNLAERIQVLPMFKIGSDAAKEDYRAVITQKHVKADGTVVEETYEIAGADCVKSGVYLGVYIDDMDPNEMRDTMTVTLYKGDEQVSVVNEFSPESVLKSMMEDKGELITAIMNYADCAFAKFG